MVIAKVEKQAFCAGACDVCAYGTPIPGEMCGANDDDALTAGNVAVTNGSQSIEFVNCSFRHLGAAAASTRGGSQDIAWRRCSFEVRENGLFFSLSSHGPIIELPTKTRLGTTGETEREQQKRFIRFRARRTSPR